MLCTHSIKETNFYNYQGQKVCPSCYEDLMRRELRRSNLHEERQKTLLRTAGKLVRKQRADY